MDGELLGSNDGTRLGSCEGSLLVLGFKVDDGEADTVGLVESDGTCESDGELDLDGDNDTDGTLDWDGEFD